MSYAKTIVCLADSFKPPHGRCVAGREILPDGRFGGWIRPVSRRTQGGGLSAEECVYPIGARPRLLDVIEISFESLAPGSLQSENHFISQHVRWMRKGVFPWARLAELVQTPWGIWGHGDHTSQGKLDCASPAEASQFLSMLLLISVDELTIYFGTHPRTNRPTCRGAFQYQDRVYNLSITDPGVRTTFNERVAEHRVLGAYLCLSLTEPYQRDGRCHKLIAAVLTKARG